MPGRTFVEWWCHAFATPAAPSSHLSDSERQHVAEALRRRGLAVPAAILLESSRPLAGLAQQAGWFVAPWLSPFMSLSGLERWTGWLSQPSGIDRLLDELHAEERATGSATPSNADRPRNLAVEPQTQTEVAQ
jgi:hypothetical protein